MKTSISKISQLANFYFKLCFANDEDWIIQNIKYLLSFFMGTAESNILTPEEIKHWANINRLPLDMFEIPPRIINDGAKFLVLPDTKKHNVDYYFSLSSALPTESQNEDVTSARPLNSYKNIPPLFFCNKIVISETSKLDPVTSHNFFIVRGLQKASQISLEDPAALEAASQFIRDNIDAINKIRGHFQYTPRELGEGMDGVVFDISDFAVLKIFSSYPALEAAERAMERMHRNPEMAKTEAMVYDADILGSFTYPVSGKKNSVLVFYSIVEKMITMESMFKKDAQCYKVVLGVIEEMRDILHNNRDKLDELIQMFDSGNKDQLLEEMKMFVEAAEPYIRQKMQDEIDKMEAKYLVKEKTELQPKKKESQAIEIRPGWLASLIEEILFKRVTKRSDLHMGNIGITGYGDFRFFDPIFIA